MRSREAVLTALALAMVLAISISYANVFVYYPIQVSISPVNPPVYFQDGSNADQNDIGGQGSGAGYQSNTINVTVSEGGTKLEITVHPTLKTAYYKDIARIKNDDGKTYYIYLDVDTAASLPAGSKAKICFFNSGTPRQLSGWPDPEPQNAIQCVNLLSTTNPAEEIGPISSGSTIEIDLLVYIAGGTVPQQLTTAKIHLIYTPTQETPPS